MISSGWYLSAVLLLTIVFIVYSGTRFHWHPFVSLLLACLFFGIASGMDGLSVLDTIGSGFGSLIGKIGLVVVLGSVLGVLLEESGAVQRLGQLVQQRSSMSPSLGITLLGMVLGIPVFCDSGFMILVSLARSVGQAAAVPASTMTLGLAGGLYTTHTLVPPTPGPMNAAANLGAGDSLGLVILLGMVVSLPVSLVAFFYARYIGPKITVSIHAHETLPTVNQELPLWVPLVLIFLPVTLIAVGSVLALTAVDVALLEFAGQPMIALLLTVAIGLYFFRQQGKTAVWIEKGIKQAGPIVLLTGCGGAFGAVLGKSPLAAIISAWTTEQSLGGISFLVVCFGVSALFKSAQGSSTSAMLIVSSLAYPLAAAAGFTDPVELSLLVLAIGAGAMTVSHANDSYFWVVSQFGGIDLASSYRGWTIMTLLQGLMALGVVVLLYGALV